MKSRRPHPERTIPMINDDVPTASPPSSTPSRAEELSTEQREFARLIGILLARRWRRECALNEKSLPLPENCVNP